MSDEKKDERDRETEANDANLDIRRSARRRLLKQTTYLAPAVLLMTAFSKTALAQTTSTVTTPQTQAIGRLRAAAQVSASGRGRGRSLLPVQAPSDSAAEKLRTHVNEQGTLEGSNE